MYYYTVSYSFDPDVPVKGPFADDEQCWAAMVKDAEDELRIDTEEAGFNSTLEKNEDNGTITLTNLFENHDDDVTTWQLIDVPYAPAPEVTATAKQILQENGITADKAENVLQQLITALFCLPQRGQNEPHTAYREIAGDNVEIQAFGDKMRYTAYGSFYEVPQNAEELLADKHMRLTRYRDGSALVELQRLVSTSVTDEEMDSMGDAALTEMEKAMGLPEGEFLSTSGWYAGHSDNNLDGFMTEEEQNIVKGV